MPKRPDALLRPSIATEKAARNLFRNFTLQYCHQVGVDVILPDGRRVSRVYPKYHTTHIEPARATRCDKFHSSSLPSLLCNSVARELGVCHAQGSDAILGIERNTGILGVISGRAGPQKYANKESCNWATFYIPRFSSSYALQN